MLRLITLILLQHTMVPFADLSAVSSLMYIKPKLLLSVTSAAFIVADFLTGWR